MDVEIPEEVDDALDPEVIEEDEENDEWGNPVGTEYDDAGQPLLEEPEPVVETPDPVAPTPRAPSTIQIPTLLSAEEREYGEAIFTPQQLAFMESLNARSFAAGQASMAVASAGVEQVLSGATAEYRQMVSPRLNTVISRMTPQQRADPHAADDALAVIMAEEARETGEGFWQVVARHSQMRGGSAAPKPRAVIPPKPAAARAPSPSNSGRAQIARSTASGASRNIKMVADTLGISVREAENMGL